MMLTPCWPSAGPTGGAGGAAPAWIGSLITAVNRFLGGMSSFFVTGWNGLGAGPRAERSEAWRAPRSLNLLDLAERQLDRSLAAEDGDEHLQLLLLGVDLVDGGRERGERTVHDGEGLATSGAGGSRRGGRRQDLHDLVEGERRRLGRRPDETGDARRVADRAPRLVVELHADEEVAGQHLAVDLRALAVLDLGDLLGGHLDLVDVVLDVQRLDPRLEVGLHLVLVAGVGVHDVPVAGRDPQRLAQRLDRVVVLLDRRLDERVAHQAVGIAALDLGGHVGDLARGVEVGGVAGALGGAGLTRAGVEVGGAALLERGVVEVGGQVGGRRGAVDRAVGLEGLAGVGHRDLFLVVKTCHGAGDQPKTAITPLAKSRSRPATSATMNATNTITTVV